MATHLPRTLRISGHTYKIKTHENKPGALLGFHDRMNLTIGVMKASKSQMAASILHEILHAAIAESGLRAIIGTMNLTWDLEEEIVSRMEGQVYSALRDNPKFIKYLQEA